MFRSAGANGTNGLYSPIANSDSSGFSEQRVDLSSYSGSGGYTTFNPAFRPVAGTGGCFDRSVLFVGCLLAKLINLFYNFLGCRLAKSAIINKTTAIPV